MPTQRYAVTQPPIETFFTYIKSGDIAIPEIQRPFVWSAVQVRKFLDSLFQGYPAVCQVLCKLTAPILQYPLLAS